MSEIDDLLEQGLAVQPSTVSESWVASSKYPTIDQYVDDNGSVMISGRNIGNMSEEESTKGEALSQYIEFRMPRFYDGIDLVDMLINVNYENELGEGSSDSIVNMYYNEQEMKFGWRVPNKATQIAGTLKVTIYATGTVGSEKYLFSTKPIQYIITDTLTPGAGIQEPDNNWYLQFVNRMNVYVETVQKITEDTKEAANILIENRELIEGLPALAAQVQKFVDLGLSISNGQIQQTI